MAIISTILKNNGGSSIAKEDAIECTIDKELASETFDLLKYVIKNSENGETHKKMLATICGMIHMMFRYSVIELEETFEAFGKDLILVLVDLINNSLSIDEPNGKRNENEKSTRFGSTAVIEKATEIFCNFAQIKSARVPIANYPGLLACLINVVGAKLSEDSTFNAIWTLANLACVGENMVMMAHKPGLVDILVNVADPDRERSFFPKGFDKNREQATRALMNLSAAKKNQHYLCSCFDMIELCKKLLIDENERTREYAAIALGNLAHSPANIKRMIVQYDGNILEMLVAAMRDDAISKMVLEIMKLFALDRETAMQMINTPDLLDRLSLMASKNVDDKSEILASSTLKNLVSSTNTMASTHPDLLNKIVKVVNDGESTMSLSIMAEAFMLQSSIPDNHEQMVKCKGLFEAFHKLSLQDDDDTTWSLVISFKNLSLSAVSRKAMASEVGIKILTNLITQSINDKAKEEAIQLTCRLAISASFNEAMSKNEGLMVAMFKLVSSIPSSTQRNSVMDTIILLLSPKIK